MAKIEHPALAPCNGCGRAGAARYAVHDLQEDTTRMLCPWCSPPNNAALLAACKVALPRLQSTIEHNLLAPDQLGYEHETWLAYELVRQAIALAEGGEP
jgi:uncharacterized protein CbrC (UPF0167 family)